MSILRSIQKIIKKFLIETFREISTETQMNIH